MFIGARLVDAGKLDKEKIKLIVQHLVDLALGSPTIAYLRTQLRYFEFDWRLLDAAFQ
jgi:hypothetical protein